MGILIFLLLMPSSVNAGRSALVNDLALINGTDSLLTFFKIADAFSPEMENGVQNGIPH